jgi:hypothetical protein
VRFEMWEFAAATTTNVSVTKDIWCISPAWRHYDLGCRGNRLVLA